MIEATKRLLRELEIFGKSNDGYYNIPPDTGNLLHILVRSSRAKNILEIGTSNGYSTIWLAEAVKHNNGRVTTVEISEHKVKLAQENFKRANLSDTITIIQGDVLHVIPKLDEKFDFLFIDAVKEDYVKYLKLAYSKLNSNALILADNAIMFEKLMKEYLKYVREHKGLRSVLVPIGSGVELSLKIG